MPHQDRLTETSRLVVRIARLLNRAFLLAVVIGLAASFVFPNLLAQLAPQANGAPASPETLTGLRLLILIGIVMALATDRLLTALTHLIASARAADPFAAANATRLRQIGWSLLVLQLLDIPTSLLARFFPGLGSAAPASGISLGGWVAVLMIFVLARAFAAGAEMRDEIAATV